MMQQMRDNEGQAWEACLRAKGDAAQAKSASMRNAVDPQAVEDLVQSTQDALALAHSIIDTRGNGALLPPAGAKKEDPERLQNSLQNIIGKGDRPKGRGLLGALNELEEDSPRSTALLLAGLHNTPAAVAASAARSASPRSE